MNSLKPRIKKTRRMLIFVVASIETNVCVVHGCFRVTPWKSLILYDLILVSTGSPGWISWFTYLEVESVQIDVKSIWLWCKQHLLQSSWHSCDVLAKYGVILKTRVTNQFPVGVTWRHSQKRLINWVCCT